MPTEQGCQTRGLPGANCTLGIVPRAACNFRSIFKAYFLVTVGVVCDIYCDVIYEPDEVLLSRVCACLKKCITFR